MIFAFVFTTAYSQPYTILLDKLNVFLKTFDNGYYGHLEIKNDVLYDYYKNGTYSKININDISEAKVVDANRKIQIFCNQGLCVTTNSGGKFDNMPFSATADFDALGFAIKINALVKAFRNKNIPEETEVIKTDETFPVGCKVRLIKVDKPYNLTDAVNDEMNSAVTGIVVGSNLEPVGDGWYSGRIKMEDGRVTQYPKAKFQIIK